MILNALILLTGLSLLLYSADKMIGSADLIAKKFSLPPILIGLTIIAFGTSAPELVVTIIAASLAGIVFDAAIIVTTNSGAEVPKAIIVRPIRIGGKENFIAIKSALPIIWSALYKSKESPVNKISTFKII